MRVSKSASGPLERTHLSAAVALGRGSANAASAVSRITLRRGFCVALRQENVLPAIRTTSACADIRPGFRSRGGTMARTISPNDVLRRVRSDNRAKSARRRVQHFRHGPGLRLRNPAPLFDPRKAASRSSGEIFMPAGVTITSFLRPLKKRLPSSSSAPRSPVRYQAFVFCRPLAAVRARSGRRWRRRSRAPESRHRRRA